MSTFTFCSKCAAQYAASASQVKKGYFICKPCRAAQNKQYREAKQSPSRVVDAGKKFDSAKPRWDLLPFDALDEVAVVLRYGAEKYGDRNWERGMAHGRMLGALLRHVAAFATGISLDDESKLPHLSHAACCALMLLAMHKRGIGTDDVKEGSTR